MAAAPVMLMLLFPTRFISRTWAPVQVATCSLVVNDVSDGWVVVMMPFVLHPSPFDPTMKLSIFLSFLLINSLPPVFHHLGYETSINNRDALHLLFTHDNCHHRYGNEGPNDEKWSSRCSCRINVTITDRRNQGVGKTALECSRI